MLEQHSAAIYECNSCEEQTDIKIVKKLIAPEQNKRYTIYTILTKYTIAVFILTPGPS
jgi:hypothetical protein